MVKRERENFLHFSQLRVMMKKFAPVLAFVVAFVFMLLSKSENILIEKTSTVANEAVSSVVDVLVLPASAVLKGYHYLRSLQKIDLENQKLREENRRLLVANAKNRALEIENKLLSQLLNYTVPPKASFVTAKVVAEEGSAFAHSLIVYTGANPNLRKGQVVLGQRGVVGRVEKVSKHYAKIFLVNDINSKIPVMIESTRVRGVLSGENSMLPKMLFVPQDEKVNIGDKVVTSGIGGVFPAGIPVGKVITIDKKNIIVKPWDNLSNLEYVQIIDYKLPDPLKELATKEDEE